MNEPKPMTTPIVVDHAANQIPAAESLERAARWLRSQAALARAQAAAVAQEDVGSG
jgi:hypothetical protein